jgi:chromosome partitioning protein
MAVITFASSKGGAGKTTSAIVLATILARTNRVVLIDADPARRLMSWYKKKRLTGRLTVEESRGERQVRSDIAGAASRADYVILDLEGAATRMNALAISESDLVIIPMGDEQPDAEGAIETMAQIALVAQELKREIPARILFSRTQAAVKSRLAKSLNQQVRDKVGAFTTELHNRTAYSSLHNLGGSLYDMDPLQVSGLPKAIGNAELFAEEVIDLLAWLKEGDLKRRARTPLEAGKINQGN